MLEAISDFWKPVKKSQGKEKIQPGQLQIGTTVGFGIVPLASLSGRKLTVTAINTYQFGNETLTSFALGQDRESNVSLILAESEGEQYLALSRRLAITDRAKMFESQDLENILEKSDATTLPCKDVHGDFKGWTIPSYKREIQGVAGRIYKGDFRAAPLPAASQSQEFRYTLLVSENNEHAIEIEQYNGGRLEVYATVYRRLTDISEITPPARVDLGRKEPSELSSPTVLPKPVAVPAPEKKPEAPPTFKEEAAKAEPIKLPELAPTELPKAEPKITEIKPTIPAQPASNGASPMMPVSTTTENKPKLTNIAPTAAATIKQEVKTVNKQMNGLDNEALECELRVANKIIDEAIRNEMRLSDVVRRIIELPVAHQEQVHIPVTLSDDDYSLLAIRYSLAPTDRSAIKARIIEDLNDFSGDSRKKAA